MAAPLLLAAIPAAHGSTVTFSFSGTFPSAFGVIEAGDSFSGTATWDTASVGSNPSFPTDALLTSLVFTMNSSDGLSVTSLPDANLTFAGAAYTASSSGVFEFIQLNDKSTADGNFYIFFLGGITACNSGSCNAQVDNQNFTQVEHANTYSIAGPTPTPEPGSWVLLLLGTVGVLAGIRRSGRQAPKAGPAWLRRALASALFAVSAQAGPIYYTVTDLGTLGGNDSYGNGVNASGEVAGFSLIAGNAGDHAFLWNGSAMQDLGTLGGYYSYATGINGSAEATGYATTPASNNSAYNAVVWNGTGIQSLGALGGSNSEGYGINSSGEVAGASQTAAGDTVAFLWNGSTMLDLGALPGRTDSLGQAINDNGEVAGSSFNGGAEHAFLWNGSAMQDLGTLGGNTSTASGINASGEVTGTSATAGNSQHAFFWNGTTMLDLGSLGGAYSEGMGINDSGEVVGTGATSGNAQDAFIWDGTQMLDLNSYLVNGAGWQLNQADGINDAGQITGYGTIGGDTHAFLLTPETQSAPEPATSAAVGIGLIAVAGLGRRRQRSH